MGGGRVREDEGLEILDGKCRAEVFRSRRGCHANFKADVMKLRREAGRGEKKKKKERGNG